MDIWKILGFLSGIHTTVTSNMLQLGHEAYIDIPGDFDHTGYRFHAETRRAVEPLHCHLTPGPVTLSSFSGLHRINGSALGLGLDYIFPDIGCGFLTPCRLWMFGIHPYIVHLCLATRDIIHSIQCFHRKLRLVLLCLDRFPNILKRTTKKTIKKTT